MGNFYYNPVNGANTGKVPMKSIDKKTFKNSVEDLYRYKGRMTVGAFYPVRYLPSISVEQDSEWPIVMPAGLIVSLVPIKDASAYSSDDNATGIRTSGELYTTIGVDGVAQKRSIGLMYPEDIAGLLVPANGGTSKFLPYRDACGAAGIVTYGGEEASTTSTVSGITVPANRPMGIVDHQVFADLRKRFLNYEYNTGAIGVSLDGVITLPAVLVYGTNRTTVVNQIKPLLYDMHQYVLVSEANESNAFAAIDLGAFLKPNDEGRFVPADPAGTAADINQVFAKSLGSRRRVVYNLDEVIDSFPGMGMKGTDTGGLKARLYDFAKKIMGASTVKGASWAAVKSNLKSAFKSPILTDTASTYIYLTTVDVEFGKIL